MKKNTAHKTTDGTAKKTDNNQSNSQLIEYVQIEKTPFTAVRKEEEWYLMMGKYRLNDQPFKSLKEVQEDAKDASWFRIMQVVGVMVEEHYTKMSNKEMVDTLTKNDQKLKHLNNK